MNISIIMILFGVIIFLFGVFKAKKNKENSKKTFAKFGIISLIVIVIGGAFFIFKGEGVNEILSNNASSRLSNEIDDKELDISKYSEKVSFLDLTNDVKETLGFQEDLYFDELFIGVKENKTTSIEFKTSRNKQGDDFILAISSDNILNMYYSVNQSIAFKGIKSDEYNKILQFGLDSFKEENAYSYNISIDNCRGITEEEINKGAYIVSSDFKDIRETTSKDKSKDDSVEGDYVYLYIDYKYKDSNGDEQQVFKRYFIDYQK